MVNLMVGLYGYTLCSGIVCEELNGEDYRVIPLSDDSPINGVMKVGYIVKKNQILSSVGKLYIEKIQEFLPVDEKYVLVLLKMTGATYIGQFSSSICKDAGYQMIGTQIDLFCKLSVMVLSMPVLLAILDTISEFMI